MPLAIGVAGALMSASLPPDPRPWMAVAGFVVWMAAWSRASDPVEAFLVPWCAFTLASMPSWPWIVRHPSVTVSVAGWAVLVLVPMFVAAAASIAWRIDEGDHRKPKSFVRVAARGLTLVSSLLLAEWLLYLGPLPLPWALPTQYFAPWTLLDGAASRMAPTAAAAIPLGVAWLIAQAPDRSVSRVARRLSLGVVVTAMFLLAALPVRGPHLDGASMNVGLIQPGLAAQEWDAGDRLQRLTTVSDSLLEWSVPAPGWLLWPETSLRGEAEISAAGAYARERNVTIVAGAMSEGPRGRSNALLVVSPDGVSGRYEKRILVPFVEWVPFEDRVPFLGIAALEKDRYLPGTNEPVLDLPGGRVGTAICFETLFPSHAARAAAHGARMLVAVTNDGWWTSDVPGIRHVAFARRRAIETGLPLVQSSVSGVTGWISPDGRIREIGPAHAPVGATVRIDTAHPRVPPTDSIPLLAAVSWLAASAWLARRRNRSGRMRVDGAP